jgi:putative aldouronate transport system substrate-binding protein
VGAVAGGLAGGKRIGSAGAAPATPTPPGLTEGVDYFPSPAPGVPDAYLRPPAPFRSVDEVPGSGETVTTLQVIYASPVPPRDENPFWQELERRLGVTLEAAQVPTSSYGERAATTLAGGDLPDLMFVDSGFLPTLPQLAEQGAFTDLTGHLTGDALQAYPNLARFPDYLWRNVAINGRIFGVPRPRFLPGGAMMFRQDWADRLGVPRLGDAEAFLQLMVAFTENDPDVNGRADTWGLSAQTSSPDFGLGLFGNVFRAPNGWRLEADGGLTSSLETEEYRQAVGFARRLFEAGIYHPEVNTMSSQQAKEGLTAGAFGGYVTGISALPGSGGLRALAQRLNPAAHVVGLVPFGHDGNPGVANVGSGFFGSTAIPSGRDEGRVQELLQILNYLAAPFGSEERVFLDSGIEDVHHTLRPDGTRVRTEQGVRELGELGELVSGLANAPQVCYYPDTPGDARYMQELVRDLLAIGIENPTLGLYSPTAVEDGSILSQLVNDVQTAVITGRESPDALVQMAEEWRQRGGDRIREEYREALAAR